MKPIVASIAAGSLLAALALAQPPRYIITDLGTLQNGTFSTGLIINRSGQVAGNASPADGTSHAVVWRKAVMTDLSQFAAPELRGLNSQAFGINDAGAAAGEAESSIPDPNREDFCGFQAMGLPTLGHTCLPFVWRDSVMSPLPTLGGPNGSAATINNLGQVVGYAENTTRDPSCPAPQQFQFRPVLWERGKAQELPIFPGDAEGIAIGINDSGIVAGTSGSCAAFNPGSQIYMTEAHALLWQNGTMTDLGNLGGTGAFAGNQSCAANNLGQAVGNSDLKGDTTTRAFLWQKGVMKDLGLLPGDVASLAFNINDRGEIVGIDLDADFNLRAILWENGVPYDLNTLVRGKTGLYLQLAESINAEGVIAGFGQTATGETHGFVATPIPNSAAAVESISTTEQAVTMPLAVSERARRLLLRHVPTGRLAARLRDMR